MGALKFMPLFVEEKSHKNKEAVLGALSSFLRAENFNSKREFVGVMGGIQFLAALLHEKSYSLRLHKKVLILLHDMVINDENIMEQNPDLVRKSVGEKMDMLPRLFDILKTASEDLSNG